MLGQVWRVQHIWQHRGLTWAHQGGVKGGDGQHPRRHLLLLLQAVVLQLLMLLPALELVLLLLLLVHM
jgi:hypothetical protein